MEELLNRIIYINRDKPEHGEKFYFLDMRESGETYIDEELWTNSYQNRVHWMFHYGNKNRTTVKQIMNLFTLSAFME